MLVMLATYNNGPAPDSRVIADWRMLLHTVPDVRPVLLGTQETGDRNGVVGTIDAEPGTTVLRANPGTAAARLALALRGLNPPGGNEWGYWTLNPGQEPVERTVKGSRDGTAEPKFIEWVTVEDTLIGTTHFIPSTSTKTITGKWKHPKARDVYRLQVARSVAWFAQGGDVLMGDFNGPPLYELLAPLREVATCYFTPSHGTSSIDHIWVRKGSGLTVTGLRALDGFSSDHRPVIGWVDIPLRVDDRPTPEDRAATLIRAAAEPVLRPKVKALMLAAASDLDVLAAMRRGSR